MGCGGGGWRHLLAPWGGQGAPGISHRPVPPGQGRIWKHLSGVMPAIPLLAPLQRAWGWVWKA